jgi:hypothetical protein
MSQARVFFFGLAGNTVSHYSYMTKIDNIAGMRHVDGYTFRVPKVHSPLYC